MAGTRDLTEFYRPTPDDQRLIAEFRENPIGHHSPDLQRLLNRMRGAPMTDKYCLLILEQNREWQLAKTSGVRGRPPKRLNQRFSKIEDAEWYVFRKRWKALTGETLQP